MAGDPIFGGDSGVGLDPGAAPYWNYLRQKGGWRFDDAKNTVTSFEDPFKTTFKNLLGRDPTQDEISKYFSTDFLKYGSQNLDPYTTSQNYVTNAFGPDIAKYSQQQQTQQLGTDQSLIQDMINKTMGNTASALSDPNSQIFQKLAGSMNNMGISPSSGAFQAGAGSTIANSGLNMGNNALQAIGIPAVQGIGQTGQNPYQGALSAGSPTPYLQGMNEFLMQEQLGQSLSDQMAPSTAQKDIGMAAGAGQALGGFGQGMGGVSQLTSYVCMELVKRGLLCEMDMDDFHVHIMPALFKKGRAFWKYAVDGKRLVDSVNARGIDWKPFKPLLFDRVMAEPDACKAVDLYADACHQLCLSDSSLWDARVYRTSLADSIPFLPALLCYKPFQKALWKCLRIKILILYDRPRCDHASR